MKEKIMDQETIKVAGAGVTGTLTTMAGYAELLNPIISACIGIASLVYIISKIIRLWTNKKNDR